MSDAMAAMNGATSAEPVRNQKRLEQSPRQNKLEPGSRPASVIRGKRSTPERFLTKASTL